MAYALEYSLDNRSLWTEVRTSHRLKIPLITSSNLRSKISHFHKRTKQEQLKSHYRNSFLLLFYLYINDLFFKFLSYNYFAMNNLFSLVLLIDYNLNNFKTL